MIMNKLAVDLVARFNSPIGTSIFIGDLVSIFLSNAVFFAGFLISLVIIIAGIGMIRGAGSGNPEQMERGKKAITAGIIGFVIIFSAYWIIQLVEAMTGIEILNPTGI